MVAMETIAIPTVVLILAALWVMLFAWTVTALARDARIRRARAARRSGAAASEVTTSPEPPRPNVLCWFVGALVFGAGLLMIVGGVGQVLEADDHPDPFGAEGSAALADAIGRVIWGAVTVTNGAYVWRGARRRGWLDRLGRLIIIVGYILVGVALDQATQRSMDLWAAGSDGEADAVLGGAMVQYLAWGAPGALLVFIGTKMANEQILMTTDANVRSH